MIGERIAPACMLALALVTGAARGEVGPPGDYLRLISEKGPFVLHYPRGRTTMAEEIDRLLAAAAAEIAGELGLARIDTVEVFIAAGENDYRILHRGVVPEWGSAFSSLTTQELGINAGAVLLDPRPLDIVVRHELSHLLFAQRVGPVPCPVWFLEGLAMKQSREWRMEDGWRLASAVWRDDAPFLDDLRDGFPRGRGEAERAYLLSYAAVGELFAERPADLVTFSSFIRDTGDFERAFLVTFGEHPDDFSLRFHEILGRRYRTPGAIIVTSPYWAALALLFLLAFVLKGRRARKRLREMEEAEGA